MKISITLLLLIVLMLTASAQGEKSQTVDFYGVEVAVPEGCDIKEASVNCGNQFVQWIDMEKLPIPVREQFASDFKTQLKQKLNCTGEYAISCSSFGEKLQSSLLAYEKSNEKVYQIFAHGKVNAHETLIICRLTKKPKSNAGLPEFVRNFIQLK